MAHKIFHGRTTLCEYQIQEAVKEYLLAREMKPSDIKFTMEAMTDHETGTLKLLPDGTPILRFTGAVAYLEHEVLEKPKPWWQFWG